MPILFKVDLGGVGDQLYVSDVYLWAQDVPYVGTIKIGQFDAPMSLEELTGSTNETFMEYGSPVEAFAPGLKIGLQIADHTRDGRATWAVGYFTDGQEVDVGDASVSVARLTGRATWLAVQPRTATDTLIHLGISGSYVLSSRDRIRYKSRPESYLAQELVDTGDLDTNDAFPLGIEFAAKRGPVTLQFEYMASKLDTRDFGNAYLDGAYGSVSWFLTGEQRPYDASVAEMGALVPRRGLQSLRAHLGGLGDRDAHVVARSQRRPDPRWPHGDLHRRPQLVLEPLRPHPLQRQLRAHLRRPQQRRARHSAEPIPVGVLGVAHNAVALPPWQGPLPRRRATSPPRRRETTVWNQTQPSRAWITPSTMSAMLSG